MILALHPVLTLLTKSLIVPLDPTVWADVQLEANLTQKLTTASLPERFVSLHFGAKHDKISV